LFSACCSSRPPHPPRSLHDALPIWDRPQSPSRRGLQDSPARRLRLAPAPTAAPAGIRRGAPPVPARPAGSPPPPAAPPAGSDCRSEEHTSELQSRENLVCRLLLEKK